jgi:hypothetical protein
MGVLRPGKVAPNGSDMNAAFSGDGYATTAFGWEWLRNNGKRPPSDPSRIVELLGTFDHFGAGYVQRAVEAARCYQSGNYLAACVMTGAAAESILLAIAVAKSGEESKILSEYATSSGRGRITKRIVGNVPEAVAKQFQTAMQVLHYWRDDASHGMETTISELEAHASISQLLRLAQFSSDHWQELTMSFNAASLPAPGS